MKTLTATFLMLMMTLQLFAQSGNSTVTDTLYGTGKIYVVVVCVTVILLGLLLFLFTVDRRLKKIEKKSSAKN
uniref:CcmD family protein n=1 Tax=Pedobacter sp. TaxID=1411316 RepID=UPI003D7F6F14